MQLIIQIVIWAGTFLVGSVVLYIMARLFVGWTYRHVDQGQALVRNGLGGTSVSFSGMIVLPIVHRLEYMDISVKRIEIDRRGATGLICKDNLRADIKVVFFVRVEKESENVKRVAQALGCQRASDQVALVELFDAKFSDALKTAGRQFNFEELLNSRQQFREKIKESIVADLNGYVLDDASIDHLEQTSVELLDPDNILDSEGIKKITDLTAVQKILANQINRNREKTITQQDVITREAVLELNRQLAEAEEKQKREIAAIKAREESETAKIQQEQKLKSEKARIATEEEVQIADENKQRQVIVALKNKERTEKVETERVEKDRLLEANERERIVTLATIEKEKVIETEKKNIQDVIRQRVVVQKAVVEEEQKIKDTEAFATADRAKRVKVTEAEMEAEQQLLKNIKAAEASKKAAELKAEEDMYRQVKGAEAAKRAAELHAEEEVIHAQGEHSAAAQLSMARKKIAESVTAEQAAVGLAEAQVIDVKSAAMQKQGTAEAKVLELKNKAEADGIIQKAEAMKLFNQVGREHEEYKLQLHQEKEITLAEINARKDIASSQAAVVSEALKTAKIDIVGGETEFFNRIVGAITGGKSVDRCVDNSTTLTNIRDTFFDSNPEYFREQLQKWVSQFGLTSDDLKNLSIAAALTQMISLAPDASARAVLQRLSKLATRSGIDTQKLAEVLDHVREPILSKN